MSLSVRLAHAFPGFRLDVAFEAPGGVTVLFGRSGSGKTTVVNAVAGLLTPDEGRIVADRTVLLDTARGVALPPHRRRVGYVFQEGRLFPHLTVRQNLAFGRWFAPCEARLADPARVVELLGLGHLLSRRPARLSGGEKQRVAIGRALLSGPRLLLMDEPLASLDAPRKEEILPYLERLVAETAVPILYVTHQLSEVARLARTVVVLSEGRMVRAGPAADVLADPDAVPALGVREAGAVLEATVLGHDGADGLTELALASGRLVLPRIEAAVGAVVRVRIHAQDVMIALDRPGRVSALNVLPATVAAVREGEGGGAVVSLAVGREKLLARITGRSLRALALAPGTPCFAVVKSVSVARGDIGAA